MNTNLRALIFGAAVAAALTITMNTVTAAETASQTLQVIRLDSVSINAHRDAFDADGNLKVTRLAPISVIAHKDTI